MTMNLIILITGIMRIVINITNNYVPLIHYIKNGLYMLFFIDYIYIIYSLQIILFVLYNFNTNNKHYNITLS